MNIQFGKHYKTRDGRRTRIYAVGCGGNFPIHGAILIQGTDSEDDFWVEQSWDKSGAAMPHNLKHENDIVSEWVDEPEIHWEHVPKEYESVRYCKGSGMLYYGTINGEKAYVSGPPWNDMIFPNRRDFDGIRINRPDSTK